MHNIHVHILCSKKCYSNVSSSLLIYYYSFFCCNYLLLFSITFRINKTKAQKEMCVCCNMDFFVWEKITCQCRCRPFSVSILFIQNFNFYYYFFYLKCLLLLLLPHFIKENWKLNGRKSHWKFPSSFGRYFNLFLFSFSSFSLGWGLSIVIFTLLANYFTLFLTNKVYMRATPSIREVPNQMYY